MKFLVSMRKLLKLFFAAGLCFSGFPIFAQENDHIIDVQNPEQLRSQESELQDEDKSIDFVEKLLETNSNVFREAPSRSLKPGRKKQRVEYNTIQSKSFYSDLAVIQKNYMPKTGRVQISGGMTLLPSDVFFRTVGINAKVSYHFNETWGLEAFGYLFSSQAREEISKLESEQKLAVKSLISVKSFYGLNLYFNSIYGKTALLNDRIIPFELYQTIGVGKVLTKDGEEAMSVQVGVGDIFSVSRSSAVRVDLTWAFYNARNYLGDQQAANSLFLTLSYGHFFPEPSYR